MDEISSLESQLFALESICLAVRPTVGAGPISFESKEEELLAEFVLNRRSIFSHLNLRWRRGFFFCCFINQFVFCLNVSGLF